MRKSTLLSCLLGVAMPVCAEVQTNGSDTLQAIGLNEVEVLSVRATETTPVAFTNIGKAKLKKYNTGIDLPYLLTMTPSTIATSDAGTGIGYTSLRVRGTDGTRINITANGIPVNDAESHTVYWVNMPNLTSSVKDIQIQRGVGTSTNGAGAFGASVNLQTADFSMNPYAEFNGSFGSFGTHKETIKAGSGLINDHWSIDIRLSNISSDGYIDRAFSDLKSYYLQGGFYSGNTSVKFITFAGKEQTYHAWNYASKEEMKLFGRRYNSCGYMYATDNTGKIYDQNAISTYDYENLHDIASNGGKLSYYDDQTDNYIQKYYQLLLDHHFSSKLSMNAGLFFTKGDGYYQEYKANRKFTEYALIPFTQDGSTIKKSDLVRKKAMDNGFGGGVFSISYKTPKLNAVLGGGLYRYEGKHFGNVLWVKNYIGELNPNHEYYRNKGEKNDGNIYLKADYKLTKTLNAYADIQYRHITYKINGTNDKWNSITNDGLQQLLVNENFDFFNPKAGLSWQINKKNRIFASLGITHKEPTRNNYTDGKLYEHPKAEKLTDYELGYNFSDSRFHAGINFYYMDYKDQLVLTGELNEIGEALADNVPDSYRTGIELAAGINDLQGFSWDANATFSKNRIKNFTETLYENEDVSGKQWKINHGDTPIAFSPDIILNNILGYKNNGFDISLHSQYVSKQYMSNAKQQEHKLDAYFVSNLHLAYTFGLSALKSVTVGISVYNIFDEEYENNGYAGSGFYFDGNDKIRYNYAGYAAQAGTNVLGHISIKF